MSLIVDGTTGVTFNDSSLQGAAASPYVLKNRIINGDMRIDQRNSGASVNNNTTGTQYTLDRWLIYGSQASKFSIQQNAGSVTPPTGYTNYLGATSLSAYTLGASEEFDIIQRIEGYNMSDFGWGTASAKSVTFSFWVRSSLTGTFGGAFGNSGLTRAYPFSYTISNANTWEQKTVTIAGDTSGTWLSTNGIGIQIYFSIGCGTTLQGTPGVWGTTLYLGPTGQTSVVGTNGATWYITGVQLEIGTSATPFERRLYGNELALCQRYYNRWSGANAPYIGLATCSATGSTAPSTRRASWANPVDFRSQPTMGFGGTIQLYTASLSNLGFTGFNGTTSNKNIISFDINSSSSGTTGQALMLIIDSASAANYIDASAEL